MADTIVQEIDRCGYPILVKKNATIPSVQRICFYAKTA